jgi:hypothetical protein
MAKFLGLAVMSEAGLLHFFRLMNHFISLQGTHYGNNGSPV